MAKKNDENYAPLPRHARNGALVNRIAGQVSAIGKMMTEDRYCPEILNQIRAARAALRTLESRVLEVYLQSCVHDTFASGSQADQKQRIDEIVKLFNRYDGAEV